MEVSAIIPALDEEVAVGVVVGGVPRDLVSEVIVVDNGSTDRTGEVAAAAGALVVQEPRRGYGAACFAGAEAAGGEVLVFLDADGSFDPGEIPAVVGPLLEGRADLVLGSRCAGGPSRDALLPHQRYGNWLAVQLLGTFVGLRVTDLGPFRAIRRSDLLQLRMAEMTYGWPIEMMIKAARSNYRVMEVPVSYRPRLGGQSKVSGNLKGSVRAGYRIVATILKHARPGRRSPDHEEVSSHASK